MTSFNSGDEVVYFNNNGRGRPNLNGQIATVIHDRGDYGSMVTIRFNSIRYRDNIGDDDTNRVYRANIELVSAGASAIKEPDESIYNDLI